jgi:hypothetical protein
MRPWPAHGARADQRKEIEMGRKKQIEAEAPTTDTTEGTETNVAVEQAAEPQVEVATAAEATPKKKGKKAKGDLTLADLAERYLAHMEESGKSSGTVFSYRLELVTAMNALGADTKVAAITPAQVLVFFGSEKVTKTRSGREKSPLSIAKTQRVLRLALVWAVGAKLIESAPLPEATATH